MDNPVPTKSCGVEGASGTAGGDATAAPLDITRPLKRAMDEDVKRDVKIARYKDILNTAHQHDGSTIRPHLRILLDKNTELVCDMTQFLENAQKLGVDQNTMGEMKANVKSNVSMCYMLLKQISTPRI